MKKKFIADVVLLQFQTEENLTKDATVSSTKMFLDGKLSSHWTLEESLIDEDHCVAVCLKKTSSYPPKVFQRITNVEELLNGLEPLEEDLNETQEWMILHNMTRLKPF